jgi:hypothetical protein
VSGCLSKSVKCTSRADNFRLQCFKVDSKLSSKAKNKSIDFEFVIMISNRWVGERGGGGGGGIVHRDVPQPSESAKGGSCMQRLHHCRLMPMRLRSALSLTSCSVRIECDLIPSERNLPGFTSSARSAFDAIIQSENVSGSDVHSATTS